MCYLKIEFLNGIYQKKIGEYGAFTLSDRETQRNEEEEEEEHILMRRLRMLHTPADVIQAIDNLDDVIDQAQTLLTSFESTISIEDNKHHDRRDSARPTPHIPFRLDPSTIASLDYLTAHLEALSMTLSVLLQSLYTAQTIMWSK
jgi:hypothetical protein